MASLDILAGEGDADGRLIGEGVSDDGICVFSMSSLSSASDRAWGMSSVDCIVSDSALSVAWGSGSKPMGSPKDSPYVSSRDWATAPVSLESIDR